MRERGRVSERERECVRERERERVRERWGERESLDKFNYINITAN